MFSLIDIIINKEFGHVSGFKKSDWRIKVILVVVDLILIIGALRGV